MASPTPHPGRCGAKSRRHPGKFCMRYPVNGRNRCHIHGGKSPRGPASASYKGGRYSRWMGGVLREAYESSLRDHKLLDLTESVAMMDAIAKRAAQRVTERDTPDFRARAIELYTETNDALKEGDTAAASQSLDQLGELLRAGSREDAAMRHLSEAIENYSKRAEKATSLKLAKHASIPAVDLVAILGRIAEAVTRTAPREVAYEVMRVIDHVIDAPKPAKTPELIPEPAADVASEAAMEVSDDAPGDATTADAPAAPTDADASR